ncbi:ribonuclease H-like protein [Pholiota conissans]|uniref:DNA polymerase delta catalytic subunit n=1 Tax=Pholiota conissans TaxID=109636 RepID=A0A9P6CXY5_9AGAR|nr:ribonuclease H-like protein [Pholiota conissans]
MISLSPYNSPTKKHTLGPQATNSFIDVLSGMSLSTDLQEHGDWARPAPPKHERRKSIKFQKLDIREANEPSGRSQIHLFGVTKDGYSILVRVLDFPHYFYYPAPQGFEEEDLSPLCEYVNELLLGTGKPVVSEIQLETQTTCVDGRPVEFLKISLFDHRKMRRVKDIFMSGRCQYRDLFSSPELSYEASIPYFLRFMLDTNILCMTWLQLPKNEYNVILTAERVSCCQQEVSISLESLRICHVIDDQEKFAPLRILSFDIESDLKSNGKFPDPRGEAVIQIGNMISVHGQDIPCNRTVFTLGSCSAISGAHVLSFEDESKMLLAWSHFFLEVDPDVVIGYNITQFDIPYLLNRAQTLNLHEFPFLGRVRGEVSLNRNIIVQAFPPHSTLGSPQSMAKRQNTFPDCPGYEGRLLLDVYFYIREHYPQRVGSKFKGSLKLNAVAKDFLQDTKEDVDHTQIPILYRGNPDTRRQLALYCLKDAYLPLLLLKKLKCFEQEVRVAREASVPFNTLRVWRTLKNIAKRYIDAISGVYLAADPQGMRDA